MDLTAACNSIHISPASQSPTSRAADNPSSTLSMLALCIWYAFTMKDQLVCPIVLLAWQSKLVWYYNGLKEMQLGPTCLHCIDRPLLAPGHSWVSSKLLPVGDGSICRSCTA